MDVTGVVNSNEQIINNYIAQKEKTAADESAASSSQQDSLVGNYDTFLKILTTQLKNQDPTSPMDASEFTDQLVKYSQVEQQISTNDKLEQMLQNQNSNGITPLLNYVGRYAEVASDEKMVVQGGKAMMAYNLPANTTSASISIQDAKGQVIATIEGPAETGLNRIAWDGQMKSGGQAPDGVYKYVLTAKNSGGDSVAVEDVRVIGQVTGVETDAEGDISLKIGDLFVKDTAIKSVFANIGSTNGSQSEDDTNADDAA